MAPKPWHGRQSSTAQREVIQRDRDPILWERNFPQTPTQHALRTDRYKYIRYHGLWDSDELYDLAQDPHETRNLARRPEHAQTARDLNARLFEVLTETNGLYIPLYPDRGGMNNLRRQGGSRGADFPADYYVAPKPPPGQGQ